MTGCETLAEGASKGLAPTLRAVDCFSADLTATTFGRLFGDHGVMAPALTILLTLYIAFFAISLLTGRSTLNISALTPRMLTLGLVLTFATSWVAYQSVAWNLAVGGPDWIASLLMGTKGSATQVFADRIDLVFAAITDTADGLNGTPQAGAAGAATFAPVNLMWLSGLLLMLGTVGVLVTGHIALAVLLALGPIFVVLALFGGTRGIFVGWLRGVVLTAVMPLFAVVGGGFMLKLAVPVIAGLRSPDGLNTGSVMALFMISAAYTALMALVLQISGTMVSGWSVFGLAKPRSASAAKAATANAAIQSVGGFATAPSAPRRFPAAALAGSAWSPSASETAPASSQSGQARRIFAQTVEDRIEMTRIGDTWARARGIGSLYRGKPSQFGMIRSKEMAR
jgi:type IV secretion system protein VirB6